MYPAETSIPTGVRCGSMTCARGASSDAAQEIALDRSAGEGPESASRQMVEDRNRKALGPESRANLERTTAGTGGSTYPPNANDTPHVRKRNALAPDSHVLRCALHLTYRRPVRRDLLHACSRSALGASLRPIDACTVTPLLGGLAAARLGPHMAQVRCHARWLPTGRDSGAAGEQSCTRPMIKHASASPGLSRSSMLGLCPL